MPHLSDQYLLYDGAKAEYDLLGFIDSADRLVTWTGDTSYNTLLVDFCVANVESQSGLERAGIANRWGLSWFVECNPTALAYPSYYDAKYGTTYSSVDNPRSIGNSPILTGTEEDRFRGLLTLAGQVA